MFLLVMSLSSFDLSQEATTSIETLKNLTEVFWSAELQNDALKIRLANEIVNLKSFLKVLCSLKHCDQIGK